METFKEIANKFGKKNLFCSNSSLRNYKGNGQYNCVDGNAMLLFTRLLNIEAVFYKDFKPIVDVTLPFNSTAYSKELALHIATLFTKFDVNILFVDYCYNAAETRSNASILFGNLASQHYDFIYSDFVYLHGRCNNFVLNLGVSWFDDNTKELHKEWTIEYDKYVKKHNIYTTCYSEKQKANFFKNAKVISNDCNARLIKYIYDYTYNSNLEQMLNKSYSIKGITYLVYPFRLTANDYNLQSLLSYCLDNKVSAVLYVNGNNADDTAFKEIFVNSGIILHDMVQHEEYDSRELIYGLFRHFSSNPNLNCIVPMLSDQNHSLYNELKIIAPNLLRG